MLGKVSLTEWTTHKWSSPSIPLLCFRFQATWQLLTCVRPPPFATPMSRRTTEGFDLLHLPFAPDHLQQLLEDLVSLT